MSAVASQPLHYRDGVDDALVARYHTRQLIAVWIATPAVILLAFTGVGFYFAGTCSAVWATALSTTSLATAALWMLASLAFFTVGCLIMLAADCMERTFA